MLKTSEFIPVIDGLIAEMKSLYAAYVYGYIYLNQQTEKTFDQSLQTIAKRARLSRSTVLKWVKFLCENGYLIDLTPGEISKPHVYQITEKATLEVHITFQKVTNFNRGGVRGSEGGEYKPHTPGSISLTPMFNDHDDDTWSLILNTWQAIGLDAGALPAAAKNFDDLSQFAELLLEWKAAAAEQTLPGDWGYGLIYKRIKAGQRPPEKKKTFGDEVKELMEWRLAGELE